MIVFLAIALLAAVLEVVLYMVADFFVGIAVAYGIARFLCGLVLRTRLEAVCNECCCRACLRPALTTQRYMHLSPGATEAAIALLEAPPPRRVGAGHDHRLGVWRGAGDGQRSLAKHGLKIDDLASEPLRGTSPSEVAACDLGVREADVQGSHANRSRGS